MSHAALLRLLSLAVLAFGLSACNDDEDDSWTSASLEGEQSEHLVYGDRTRVNVSGTVSFAAGVSMTLRGEVEFRMGDAAVFEWPDVYINEGDDEVRFLPAGDSNWGFVRVDGGAELTKLSISGAQIGLNLGGGGLVKLNGVDVSDCLQYGIYAVSLDSLVLNGCQVSGVLSDGLHAKFGPVMIQNSSFSECAANGVYLLDCQSTLLDCSFSDNGNSGEAGSALTVNGTETSYVLEYCHFEGNYYGLKDTANRDVVVRYNDFVDATYFPLLFAHPYADRVILTQNNILPGPGGRRVELATTNSYRENRYLPATHNWWGTTNLDSLTAATSFSGDGRWTANSDTIRVEPVLLEAVANSGPRQ